MSTTIVVNIKYSRCDIRCCRPGRWGNRFRIGKDGDRNTVIVKFGRHTRKQIAEGKIKLKELAGLSGKRLGCYCAPQPCHANVLAKLADAAKSALNALETFRLSGATAEAVNKARTLIIQAMSAPNQHIALEQNGDLRITLQEEGTKSPAKTFIIQTDGTHILEQPTNQSRKS